MMLLPSLLLALWGDPGRCLEENGGFTFDGDIRRFAVASDTAYVATEKTLYQLSHDLTQVHSLTLRGMLTVSHQTNEEHFSRVAETDEENATFGVHILLPFVKNESLVICGVIECGYCEVLDLKNISNVQYKEHIQVGSMWPDSASVGFLVDAEERNKSYILTANQQDEQRPHCVPKPDAVYLHNTQHNQTGHIFSMVDSHDTPSIQRINGDVKFVDGFQINSSIYLFSNLPSSDKNNKVRLIWLWVQKNKKETFGSLRGATLSIPGGDGGKGSELLASAVIPGGPQVLWSGVFRVGGGQTPTELVLFDISPDLSGSCNDPDFHVDCKDKERPTVGRFIDFGLIVFFQVTQIKLWAHFAH